MFVRILTALGRLGTFTIVLSKGQKKKVYVVVKMTLGRDNPSSTILLIYYDVTSLLAYNVGQHEEHISKSVYKLLG